MSLFPCFGMVFVFFGLFTLSMVDDLCFYSRVLTVSYGFLC